MTILIHPSLLCLTRRGVDHFRQVSQKEMSIRRTGKLAQKSGRKDVGVCPVERIGSKPNGRVGKDGPQAAVDVEIHLGQSKQMTGAQCSQIDGIVLSRCLHIGPFSRTQLEVIIVHTLYSAFQDVGDVQQG
jgi:hypothetical protein